MKVSYASGVVISRIGLGWELEDLDGAAVGVVDIWRMGVRG